MDVTEQRSEARRCIAPHLWRHVAIELERRLNAVVPKSLAHSLDVDALLEQQRGVRVTEAMQPDRRKTGQIAYAPTESPTDDVRVLGYATRPAEDQVQVRTVGLAPLAALEQLALSLFAQQVSRGSPKDTSLVDFVFARTTRESFGHRRTRHWHGSGP
jgi:hypothetical protein